MAGEPIISEYHDDPDMAELLVEFAESLRESCERLRTCLESGDLESMRRLGHQLKGSGGGYGYPQITEAGGALENEIRSTQGLTDVVRSKANHLIELCERARAGLA
jgi:HPt (histidine-containing phosphotransfer) domain-containing protein